MKIFLFTVNHKKPSWLQTMQQDYHRRLPSYVQFTEQSITPSNKQKEAEQLLDLAKKLRIKNAVMVALYVKGKSLSSEEFAAKINDWQQSGQDIVFYIGGADGLDQSLVNQCTWQWSLSPLTFSHLVAQLIFSEQIYRAFSIIQGHPYHLGH